MSGTRNVGAARMGIALIVLMLYGLTIAILANVPIPAENKDAFMLLVGTLGPMMGGVVQYYFNIPGRQRSDNGA